MNLASTERPAKRTRSIDWDRISCDLDESGAATIERLLSAGECEALAASYSNEELFRSRVVMERHGFGRGEYKYFRYPLPEVVATLRKVVDPLLAPIAHQCNAAAGIHVRYPEE